MTRPENERLAVVENDVSHLRREVAEMKVMLTALHTAFIERKGATGASKALFWGGVGLVGYVGSHLTTILSFFRGQ